MLWLLTQVQAVSFSDVEPMLPRLSEARRAQISEMRLDPPKVQSALAELLLRHALRKEKGRFELPPIYQNGHGKPFFRDLPDLQFNLSHCKTAVACALDSSPLGVDVQERRTLMRRLHSPEEPALPAIFRILSDPERAWILAGGPLEQDRRFTAVWTCKEAYGKAVGRGVLYQLSGKTFLPRPEPWEQYGFTFQHFDLEDTFATLCAASALPAVTYSADEFLAMISEESL